MCDQTVNVKPDIKRLLIVAREWFDKIYGNSYFSARVTVNDDTVVYLPFQYGYGDQYRHVTVETLIRDGWTTNPHILRSDSGVIVNSLKIENCKKRDVIAWGKGS